MTNINNISSASSSAPVSFPFNVELWYEHEGVFMGEGICGTDEVWFFPKKAEEQEFLIVCERLGLQPEKKGEKWGEVNYALPKSSVQGREVYRVWCGCGSCDPESRWFIW